jgi:hypothetical protein
VIRLVLPLLLIFAFRVAGACEVITLREPAAGSTVDQLRPTLTWQGEADGHYRLQWAALLPEARVLASHDVQVVGTRFTLPSPISAERAAMKVRITRGCAVDDPQDLNAQGPAFFIDVRAECAVGRDSLVQDGATVRWAPNPGAQGYRLRIFRAQQGDEPMALTLERDLAEPRWLLDSQSGSASRVAVVQAVCGGHPGRPAALALQPVR